MLVFRTGLDTLTSSGSSLDWLFVKSTSLYSLSPHTGQQPSSGDDNADAIVADCLSYPFLLLREVGYGLSPADPHW